MQIKPFISTAAGEIPLTNTNSIKNGQKVKLILFTEKDDSSPQNITHIEVLNPLDRKIVTGNIPKLDDTVIASLEVLIPDNWIGGRYTANVVTLAKKIACFCDFHVTPSNPLIEYLTERNTRPNWLMHYKIQVRNPTEKPIGNFSAFVALPMTLQPLQVVKELKINPATLKMSSDLEGNQWIHYEVKRINPKEKLEMSYSAKIQCNPLLLSANIAKGYMINPYSKKFLNSFLKTEPHIESDHPEIVKLASSIKTDNPIAFAQSAIRLVNRKLTYKIQPGEYGAAFAVEKGEGDCTEYAALFVALCRAKGIPARTNAGFVLAEKWERHATAEFLVSGRWIPVDVTGQRTNDVFIGHLPNNIIVTRGNWMGGTLEQEVSYRYQIMDQSQKLEVNVDWKINMMNKNSKIRELPTNKTKKKIKILEPKVLTTNRIKILDDLKDTNETIRIPLMDKEIIQIEKPIKVATKGNSIPNVTIESSFPDVMKKGQIKNQRIMLTNNSKQPISGCLELREINEGTIRLLYFQGVKISPESELSYKPEIMLKRIGINNLQLVFMNRIGRILAKEEIKTSVY